MTTYTPTFRSPISTPEPATAASDLMVRDRTGVPVILIQGETGDILEKHLPKIPANPGDLTDMTEGRLARLTPNEFYLFGKSQSTKLPSVAELNESFVEAGRFAQATDLTHGKAMLKLSGPAAAEALSKICGLDFHDSVFPNMRVKQTSAAKIKTLIARCDEEGRSTYFLHVDRPFGQYFWDIVWDAGQEFGIAVGL